MEIDKITLADLAILNNNDDFAVFSKLDLCKTIGGRQRMYELFNEPLNSIESIKGVQDTLKRILQQQSQWPTQISNGTIMMAERFFHATIDTIPSEPGWVGAMNYQVFHGPDFSLVKYSVTHCFDFLKGMMALVDLFDTPDCPGPLKQVISEVTKLLQESAFQPIVRHRNAAELPIARQLALAAFIRYRYKHGFHQLLQHYRQLDAWFGMAMAVAHYQLVFPEFVASAPPLLDADGLYHVLLPKPVSYQIKLDGEQNFLFLTGANMAGKSTFIKAVGTAVFLAHLGMGVPAKSMRLCLFDGLLSNINMADDLARGESYFYNEVQRIKATVQKVSDGRKWLILIDELFKGTNVEDAMKCSSAVIDGLVKVKSTVFILSTHLYEISHRLQQYPNMLFHYFETAVENDQLVFSYQLRKGVSNDRLGYLILKNEGVVELLEKM